MGSRGSVRVSIAAQHEQQRLGEPSSHHLHVVFFTLSAVFTCAALAGVTAVWCVCYSRILRQLELTVEG